jgi:hypothetical protein
MRGRRWLSGAASAGLVLAAMLPAAACASPQADVAREEAPAKKRGPPPAAPSVSASGVRYVAVTWGLQRGLDQNGGYVAATDEKTGRELWVAKVYATPRDPNMEDDKQDLFIKRLKVVDKGRALLVTDERGGRYRLDLATRVAAPL